METTEKPNAAAAAAVVVGDDDDDDLPVLSSHALEALREFLNEQSSSRSETTGGGREEVDEEEEVRLVAEDWRLSQFWYDRETAETLAEEIKEISGGVSLSVACISCPTLYAYLKKCGHHSEVKLLEFDKRFEQYGNDFTFYDYNQPENLPSSLKHSYQVIIADPPYLSGECLEKVALTIAFLARPQDTYLLLLTGEVQKERAAQLLNVHPCGFRPKHSNKLGNEFRLFTNYNPAGRLGGWEQKE